MTDTPKTTLELNELEDIETTIQSYNNQILDYQSRIKVLKAKVDELQKKKKETDEADKKKAEKAQTIKKLLEQTKKNMEGLETDLADTEALVGIPPKSN